MKRYLIVAVLALSVGSFLNACSGSDDPEPDPGTKVSGTYEMTKLQLDSAGVSLYNYSLPLTVGTQTLSGTIVARRDSAAVVYVTYTIKQTGQSDYNSAFGQLRLTGTATPYDIYYNTTKVGTTDGSVFTIDYSYRDDQGVSYREVYSGRKKQ